MDSLRNKKVSLEAMMPLIRQELEQGRSVRIWPNGTSMLPMLRQGVDSVILSPLPEKLKKYDLPLYRRPDGQYVLHRIIRVGQSYTCMGDHQLQPEPGVTQEQMIAVVTSFTRGDQVISVKAWRYRLYCLLWPLTRFPRKIRLKCLRRGRS